MPWHLQKSSASACSCVDECDYLCFTGQGNEVQEEEEEEKEEGHLGGSQGESSVTHKISVTLAVCSDHQKAPSDCFGGGQPGRIAKLQGFSALVWCVPARSQPGRVRGCDCSPGKPTAVKINCRDLHDFRFVLLSWPPGSARSRFRCTVSSC